jgi:hypothetical protein
MGGVAQQDGSAPVPAFGDGVMEETPSPHLTHALQQFAEFGSHVGEGTAERVRVVAVRPALLGPAVVFTHGNEVEPASRERVGHDVAPGSHPDAGHGLLEGFDHSTPSDLTGEHRVCIANNMPTNN